MGNVLVRDLKGSYSLSYTLAPNQENCFEIDKAIWIKCRSRNSLSSTFHSFKREGNDARSDAQNIGKEISLQRKSTLLLCKFARYCFKIRLNQEII
mmetsp:Transcript_26472/g.39166  ORF Transcript_26472/g.39166 Transcript_26472/m.39166 type:complete len:96 (-) Transcript_26472:64-351(-)